MRSDNNNKDNDIKGSDDDDNDDSTNPGALYLHALCSYVGTHKPSYFCHSIDINK